MVRDLNYVYCTIPMSQRLYKFLNRFSLLPPLEAASICYDERKRNWSPHFMANTIQAVIWDLDGVIIDSADEHRRAWQRLARETRITFTDADFWATFGKRNDDIIPLYWKNITKDQL